MLHEIKELERLKINAKDGDLGFVYDFYFDDENWTTRYLVADTGNWLTGRKVLVSPHSIDKPDFDNKSIPVKLIKKQIEDSPGILDDEPVSRQHESKLSDYYGWPAYWLVEPVSHAAVIQDRLKKEQEVAQKKKKKKGDPHLRSIREVRSYTVEALDGEVGQVDSFLIDDENWNIKYLVIDSRKWLSWLPGGKYHIISPEWIKEIDWEKSRIYIEYDKETLENSPMYDPDKPVDKKFENKLYDCYRKFVQRKYEFIT
jgi:hypothetical protein